MSPQLNSDLRFINRCSPALKWDKISYRLITQEDSREKKITFAEIKNTSKYFSNYLF